MEARLQVFSGNSNDHLTSEITEILGVPRGRASVGLFEDGETRVIGATLGPLAVLPEYQKTGIGSALTRAGLEAMRRAGEPFVVLVGHPTYYPRFGFERASTYGLVCEYSEAPDDAFMIIVLDCQRMQGVKGTVRFPPEFAAGVP